MICFEKKNNKRKQFTHLEKWFRNRKFCKNQPPKQKKQKTGFLKRWQRVAGVFGSCVCAVFLRIFSCLQNGNKRWWSVVDLLLLFCMENHFTLKRLCVSSILYFGQCWLKTKRILNQPPQNQLCFKHKQTNTSSKKQNSKNNNFFF